MQAGGNYSVIIIFIEVIKNAKYIGLIIIFIEVIKNAKYIGYLQALKEVWRSKEVYAYGCTTKTFSNSVYVT